MKKLCCISVTLAARLIGAFDLSTSILAINFITKEFFSDEQRLLVFDEIQIFLGLNWANTSLDSQPKQNYKWTLIFLMVYSIIHMVCSADLILASIFKRRAYAVPWLIFEIISLATQASRLTAHIFFPRCNVGRAMIGAAYVPIASFYMFLEAYFFFVVFIAQKSWPIKTTDVSLEVDELDLIQSHVVDLNSQKTSSRILVENLSVFDSPKTPISSKYHEL